MKASTGEVYTVYNKYLERYTACQVAYIAPLDTVSKADRFTTCGGDSGCNICGGLGPFLGYLPCSPHYKPEVQEDNALNGDYDFYRPVIRVENHDQQ